ncbi:solute carrier family 22 member 7-like isoform X2 [Protopterus annectens]|uniref:solute carrier family 22 member 7-like isoform X2 n=1 Tax=Protopterus annectens TaxID=7888 RepID=UPI001CFA6930|nr:solute carrier family 22 member 7-like isoform X2 [Protopterus annectens]
MMKFEEVLHEAGDFGKFQILVLALLFIPRIIVPLHFMLHNFLGLVPPHHCAISAQDSLVNLIEDGRLTVSIPKEADGTFSSCKMYSEPQFHLLSNSSQEDGNISSITQCKQGWQYDHSQFLSTISEEWNLVCEKKGLNQASATFFFIGVTFGAVIFGLLSDRFGRKKILLVTYIVTALAGMSAAFSKSYAMFAVLRSISGMSSSGMGMLSLSLGIEWITVKNRTFTGTVIGLSWCIGNILLAPMAYFIRDWHWLQFAVSAPCVLLIFTWWWIPESARWLLANRQIEMAEKVLKKCAYVNGKNEYTSKVNDETLKKVMTAPNSAKFFSYWQLVKTPQIRKTTLCNGIVWFGVAFTYYGISMRITGFGLNVYLTQFVYGAIEIPAKIGTYLVLDITGRRKGQAWTLIITGALIALTAVIPAEYGLLRSVTSIIGKGFSEAAFTIAFLFTAELYPTVIRMKAANGLLQHETELQLMPVHQNGELAK